MINNNNKLETIKAKKMVIQDEKIDKNVCRVRKLKQLMMKIEKKHSVFGQCPADGHDYLSFYSKPIPPLEDEYALTAFEEELNFLCPITQAIMKDPVIGLLLVQVIVYNIVAEDGNVYERSALISWLMQNSISPLTKQPLKHSSLEPVIELKLRIEEYLIYRPSRR
jgi:hypothetical protein